MTALPSASRSLQSSEARQTVRRISAPVNRSRSMREEEEEEEEEELEEKEQDWCG